MCWIGIVAVSICLVSGAPLPSTLFLRIAQSSDAAATNGAVRALDGINSTYSLTADQPESFWTTELGRPYLLERIELTGRSAPYDQELDGLTLRLFNVDDQVVFSTGLTNPGSGHSLIIDLPADLRARSVWIGLDEGQRNGGGNYRVGLAEVRLFGDLSVPFGPKPFETPTNTIKVAQSSNYNGPYPAENALDGDPATFTHTANQPNSFWVADLGVARPIDRVELVNRDSCCSRRLAGLSLHIFDGGSNLVTTAVITDPGLGGTWSYSAPAGTLGRYVWVGLENGLKNADGNYYVTLAEARIYSGTNLLTAVNSPNAITPNLASHKPSYMVRLSFGVPAATNANDDNFTTETRTTTQSVDGYWEVDLGTTYALYGLRAIAASGIGSRLTNTTIRLFDGAHESVFSKRLTGKPDIFDVDFNGPILARYVRLGLEDKRRTDPAGGLEWYIGMREVEVFGRPADEIGILSFSASASQVAAGQPITLSWAVEDVRQLEILPSIGSVGAYTSASGLGSLTLTPVQSTEYLLIASNAVGHFTRAVSVQVDAKPLPVFISEIVVDNQYSLLDGEGETPDWIELRNPSNIPVDLGGYALSDDLQRPQKWIFPPVQMAGHSTLIVFASGRPTPLDSAGRLHTNFRLNNKGGSLILVAPDGLTTVDALPGYPALNEDLAYGRNLAGQWCFLEPTPNAINLATPYDGWLQPLTFSHPHGFYETPFSLIISNSNPGATVTYSMDGSIPSIPYTAELRIANTKAFRAQVTKPGFKPARIQTQTYLFLDTVITSSVMRATIAKDPRYAPRLKPGLLSLPSISLVVPGQPEYQEKEGSVEILWPDGASPVQANCGVSRFGGSWQEFAKKSFRVKFRASYGVNKLRVPLLAGFDRGVPVRNSFDELEFRSGSQDMVDRGFYMASRFVEDSMLDMGSLNPHGRFVHVYLNGVYWGQYDARELLVDHFLADYLGGSHEQFVNVRGNDNIGETFIPGTPEPPNIQAWERVLSLKNNYRAVRSYLDVSHLIDFMLLWFYGNCESEYRAAGPIEAGSGFKFWMADADGFLRTSALGLNRNDNAGPGGLFGGLVAEGNSDFKMLLADRIYQHCFNDGALTPARNDARLAARMQEIQDSLVVECARWGYRTPSNWVSAAATIRSNLFPVRTTQLVSQLRSRGFYPNFSPPQFNQYGGLVTNGFQPQLSSTNGTIYYTLDGSDPRLPSGEMSFRALMWKPGAVTITQDLTLNARVRTSAGQWSALAQPHFQVNPPVTPEALALTLQVNADTASLTFPCRVGSTYQMESCDSLASPNWRLYQEITATSANITVILDPNTIKSPQQFYRVRWMRRGKVNP